MSSVKILTDISFGQGAENRERALFSPGGLSSKQHIRVAYPAVVGPRGLVGFAAVAVLELVLVLGVGRSLRVRVRQR